MLTSQNRIKNTVFSSPLLPRKKAITIGCILFASYIIRLFYAFYYITLSRDSHTYIGIIKKTTFTNNDLLEAIYPLFTWLYRLPVTIFGLDLEYSSRALNIILGTATVYLIIVILQQISDHDFLWITGGVIAATNPSLIHYSTQIQRESIYLFFSSIILLNILKYIKTRKPVYIFYLGLFSACNVLVRHESMEYIPFTLLAIFLANREKGLLQITKYCTCFLGSLIVSVLIILVIVDPNNYFLKFFFSRIFKIAVAT